MKDSYLNLKERKVGDICMGNSTSSGQPLYTMLNSLFNLLNHLVVIDKYMSKKLNR